MLRAASFLFFACLIASAPVQARDERTPRTAAAQVRERERGELEERRAQVREMREAFRSMREQLYRQPNVQDPRRRIVDQEPDPRIGREPGLRRLDPDEREGLRRAMREAAREHYGR